MKAWFSRIFTAFNRSLPGPRTFALAFLVAAALLWLNNRFLYESVWVISSSMRPTLLKNERVYLKRFDNRQPGRFDVVVIQSRVLGHRIVKRVLGLPGERVRLADSWRVYINGTPLNYTMAGPNLMTEAGRHQIQLQRNPKFFYETRYGRTDLQLGPDEYYVLGDNRLASGDSRWFGPVRRSEIQGPLTMIWYSYDKDTHRLRRERLGHLVR